MSPSIESSPIQNLEELLTQSLGSNFLIKNLEWKPLTAPGENFGSIILALNVTVTRSNDTETLNLVAKLPPTSEYLLELFDSPVTFQKELEFYGALTQEFEKLQLENGIDEKDLCIVAPKYFGGRLGLRNPNEFDEQAVIILENLKYNGYDTADRIHGLDKEHTEFALKALARLHALTVALKLKKPQLFEKIAAIVMEDNPNDTTLRCLYDMIKKAQDDLHEMEEAKPYLDRVDRTLEYCEQESKNAKKPEEPWATLVHNDFWVNNMMFRHDARGQLLGVKIVDFQLSVYDYGIKDLIFFLVSSANREVLDHQLDHMIDYYYDSFVKSLKKLKVDTEKFSKKKFDEIVNYCGPVKLSQCLMMAQVIQAPKENGPALEDVTKSVFLTRASDNVYKQKMLHIVQLFEKRGWLLE
nr:uncharacterized protein LOC117221964 [Megalopta genalis]XP_033329243.1 uncharacterized protein LOC117221964 [Megalopta genalis]XP_033329244.1 uncharacterized protein LOC117221964 [Megalopta genalis]